MTYAERLAGVNSRIGTTSIKGKEYAQVNQRLLAFWELFPGGRILTELVEDTGQRCTVRASVWRGPEELEPAATGTAFEERKGTINSTSYVENCETSAVGRALGMLGIGCMEALATAEEVERAIAQQEATGGPEGPQEDPEPVKDPADHIQPLRERLRPYAKALGITTRQAVDGLCERFGVADVRELDPARAKACAAFMDGVIRGA